MSRACIGALGLLVAAMIALPGCSASRSQLTFARLQYPVSMSAVLYGPGGELLDESNFRVVGKIRHTQTAWSLFYGAWKLDVDGIEAGPQLNQAIRALGGIGIIRLKIESSACGWTYAFPFTILPFWPGCTNAQLSGQIVAERAASR